MKSIRKITVVLVLLCTFFAVGLVKQPPKNILFAESNRCSMFRGNPERTGLSSFEGPKIGELKWKRRMNGKIVGSPVFDKVGNVYFTSEEGTISGFTPDKGMKAFSVSIGENLYTDPAIYEGYIYVGGGNPPYLYKFSIASAAKRWKIYLGSEFHSSVLIVDDILYTGTDSGYLFAKSLESDSENLLWKFNAKAPIYSSPAFYEGKIVFGTDSGDLYCLNTDGTLAWKVYLDGHIRATPMINDGYVFIGNTNGVFFKIDLNDGTIKAKFGTNGAIYSSAGLLPDGSVAVGSSDGYMYVLNSDMSVKSKFNAKSEICSSPCVASDETIYFGTKSGDLFAVSESGEELFKFKAKSSICSSPSIGKDGTLYFGDSDGWIYAIGSDTGIITVETNLDSAEFLIKGPRTYFGKGRNYIVRNAPTGDYTIVFKDVPGYKTPPKETLKLKSNGSIHFKGVYEKISPIVSAIVVSTNLKDAAFTIKGPKVYHGKGMSFTVKNVPPGSYTVIFGKVSGYKTPDKITKEVAEGEIVTFVGVYKKEASFKKVVIVLKVGSPVMTVNGIRTEVDPGRGTKPVIIPKWGRTVVPIRAIVEALGGTIEWNGKERKVTINFNGTTIELWIDKPQARVNGVMKWIDPKNHNVKPIIVNSRTMLPLRFVAESLGCTVNWDPKTRTITITYMP